MTKQQSCALAENALDYLILGGQQVREKTPRMAKHALATLADGVELLLKARLEIRDWCLVFKDVDQANRSKYESGDFQSVSFEQTVKRLANICSVQIGEKHLRVISELRRLRNQIRHFAVMIDAPVAVSLTASSLLFATEFLAEHLASLQEPLNTQLVQLRTILGDCSEFVRERHREIQADIAKAHVVAECPVCLQPTLVGDGGEVHCLFCRHCEDAASAAQRWGDRFHRRSVERCPICGVNACVDTGNLAQEGQEYTCLSCGTSGEYKRCPSCGDLHCDNNTDDLCTPCGTHQGGEGDRG